MASGFDLQNRPRFDVIWGTLPSIKISSWNNSIMMSSDEELIFF
jgi:hypothetical protein